MSPDAIRLVPILFALGIALKAATAPRRGTFLTLFGVVDQDRRPRLFRTCLFASYALAAVSPLTAFLLPRLIDT